MVQHTPPGRSGVRHRLVRQWIAVPIEFGEAETGPAIGIIVFRHIAPKVGILSGRDRIAMTIGPLTACRGTYTGTVEVVVVGEAVLISIISTESDSRVVQLIGEIVIDDKSLCAIRTQRRVG